MNNNKTSEYIEFLKGRISPNVKPEIAEKMIEYALTPEEHDLVSKEIERYCFYRKTPVSNPKIFLIISQTGGGKSALTSKILRDEGNTVVIDSDAFKAFNPKRDEIIRKYPTLYGYLTGIDAYLHRDEMYEHALKNKYNVLMEIAPSTKDKLFSVNFKELLEKGYTIEADVMAVSKINSLISVHERYEGQIESEMAAPKLTDFKRANDSYDSVELVLQDLVDMPEVELNIWKRNKELHQKGQLYTPAPIFVTNDKSVAIPLFREARRIDREETLQHISERVKIVKAQMDFRKAPTDQRAQLAQIEEIIQQIQNSFGD